MLNDGNMLLFDGLLLSSAAQRPPLAARLELTGYTGSPPERRPPVRPAGDARPGAEADRRHGAVLSITPWNVIAGSAAPLAAIMVEWG